MVVHPGAEVLEVLDRLASAACASSSWRRPRSGAGRTSVLMWWFRLLWASRIASMPGSDSPSSSASDAPPPVEMCAMRSATPNWLRGRDRVAAADHGEAGVLGDGVGDGAGAVGEVLDLEHAHRAVPEDRVRVGDARARRACDVRGPMSRPISPSGMLVDRDDLRLLVGVDRCGDDASTGSSSVQSSFLGQLDDAAGRARRLRRPRRATSRRRAPFALRKVNAIAPPIRIASAIVDEALEHADLVADLEPADDADERTVGRSSRCAELLQLALEQEAGRRPGCTSRRLPWRRWRGARCRTRR